MVRRKPRSRSSSSSLGFTFVELAVGITVLVVALGSLTATMISSSALARTNKQTTFAFEAGRSMVEELRAADFATLFATYNSTTGNGGFAVADLAALVGDADGLPGRIIFPEVIGGGGLAELREDLVDPDLGMPRDLNSDGATDAADHANDHDLLPVRVVVEWTSSTGPRSVMFDTVLGPR